MTWNCRHLRESHSFPAVGMAVASNRFRTDKWYLQTWKNNREEGRKVMRWISFVAAVLIGTIGCSQGKTTKVTGEGGKALSLTPPGSVSVKQGETATIKVKIKREQFDDPVRIDISD